MAVLGPPKVALTLGEPAGIGPDVVLKLFSEDPAAFSDVLMIAPPSWLLMRAKALGVSLGDRLVRHATFPAALEPGRLHLWWPEEDPGAPSPGQMEARLAQVVVAALEHALALAQAHKLALTTGPIHKAHLLRHADFAFAGHTEWLGARTGGEPMMLLGSSLLRVALLTTHIPLREVPRRISRASVKKMLLQLHAELSRFGLAQPRIALVALNPHAGEEGALGEEEQAILVPAAEDARRAGVCVEGPLAADTAFAPHLRKRFDVHLCCYHDQGLAPLKALAFGEAVNITLGLPIVRTSPDHGTALALAGTGRAQTGGMAAALAAARRLLAGCWPWPSK